ncbi:MAG TPA: 50S ribosomal protein L11 methyltransferase [Solirubrobacteraceae bacterium]|nr:50S ribosomal protein L11 methyltransferase [Solirubrobacteraceae bacterium]
MIRLAIRVARPEAELVLAELLELTPAGVEETDGEGDTVEYAIYGAPGELPGLPDLQAVVGSSLVEVSTSEVPDDWHERWKRFHHPILIVPPAAGAAGIARPPALHVRPPWEAPSTPTPRQDVREIVIDPGQAFGTGAHASTRMCIELLLDLAAQQQPGGPLIDIGTGSGVLAIAAALLGFAPVLGLDNEQESVVAAGENAEVNGVEIEVRRFDLRSQPVPWLEDEIDRAAAPVVLANLLRPLLLELALKMPVAPSQLIASGLLVEEVDEVVAAFTSRLGLHERSRRQSGEWAAVWLAYS